MTTAYNGEFSFSLTEKVDREGAIYLFGGIHFINAVLFIRPDPTTRPGAGRRWFAAVRPYVKREGKTELYDDTWNDND